MNRISNPNQNDHQRVSGKGMLLDHIVARQKLR